MKEKKMKNITLNIALVVLLYFLFCLPVYSQYLGGAEDGYSFDFLTQQSCPGPTYPAGVYFGGLEDGQDFDNFTQANCPAPTYPAGVYFGGLEDGQDFDNFTQANCPAPTYPAGVYFGGLEDGQDFDNFTQTTCPAPTYPAGVYFGGIEDGHDIGQLLPLSCNSPVYPAGVYYGGTEDGYAMVAALSDCAPTVDFTGAPLSVCPGGTVTFTDATAPVPTSWSWIFDGGTPATSTLQNPVVTYSTAGTYDVTLYATDNFGTGVMIKTGYITVAQQATATITPGGPTTLCPGTSVTLTASAGTSWLWSPGSETTQVITVSNPGSYSVLVDGCYVPVSSTTISLYPKPIRPQISSAGFVSSSITLTSTAASSYLWIPSSETTQSITLNTIGTFDREVTTTDANGCDSTSSMARIRIDAGSCNAALAAELLSFSAKRVDEKRVLLEWATSSETNNDYFTVERSVDYVNYEILNTVPGAGNSSTTNYYSLYDKEPYNGASYYRLLQTNFDGYTEIAAYAVVFFYNAEVEIIGIYPNPAEDQITYYLTNELEGISLKVEINDVLGRTVMSQTTSVQLGANRFITDISDLSSGVYYLVLTANSDKEQFKSELKAIKFVKE